MRSLLLDNYDSYTYNLYQLISEACGVEPLVYKNDEISIKEISKLLSEGVVDNIVISPGPGTPTRKEDIGICQSVLTTCKEVPILGVCLGHQALAAINGGRVVRAPEPVHGRLSAVQHTGHPLFADIPSGSGQGFEVVRYHSLVVTDLPDCLESIAWTCGGHHAVRLQQRGNTDDDDGHQERCSTADPIITKEGREAELIMAIAHKSQPHFGVQFHPESICTKFGFQLLHNFYTISQCYIGHTSISRVLPDPPMEGPPGRSLPPRPWPSIHTAPAVGRLADQDPLRLVWRCLPGLLSKVAVNKTSGSELLFSRLLKWEKDTFWLDSSATDRGRFSYMGGKGGSLWKRISYRLHASSSKTPQDGSKLYPESDAPHSSSHHSRTGGVVTEEDSLGMVRETCVSSFFDYMTELIAGHSLVASESDAKGLPFNFWGGLVGYLGYELKAECGGQNAHTSPTPDAAFFLADRVIAVDHLHGDVYVLALYRSPSPQEGIGALSSRQILSTDLTSAEPPTSIMKEDALHWLKIAMKELLALAVIGDHGSALESTSLNSSDVLIKQSHTHRDTQLTSKVQKHDVVSIDSECSPSNVSSLVPPFHLRHSKEQYMANIEVYRQALHAGESYEVCATTALERPHAPEPSLLYSTLRRLNPAPYSSWLSIGGADGLTVCCSSPERFLSLDRGSVLEARPIKGTAPRRPADPVEDARLAAELAGSEKERAENLMIVDLLRNDLGRVCEVGSVHVPGLMEIESYATVHQMVSTVRGLRREGTSLVECIRAAFPGGSMTGAPKIRTMEILDACEGHARGVYSGSLGFISFNDTFDLNIVIRTAVISQAYNVVNKPESGRQVQRRSSSAEVSGSSHDIEGGQDSPSERFASSSRGASDGCSGQLQSDSWVSIGAGGAIVVQSDTGSEYEEMRLKARALLQATGLCDGLHGPAIVDDAAAPYQRVERVMSRGTF
ncbi:hypothetical protein CEUSTIGMA_g3131.t1 [Chlamydomonas eustigma]|uniref:aminodeoxychorismate synthase n=1 Tax=Chlamydomonas eustigma TaxID=1157962 RepID=A0A250WXW1_9CHLO|nr:hypothetical protein CEUSTIGMA_g3131.t1 [Chlamydomonas eustigma]|eukprot:GAX75688.1 hypothetical protein CEUSTIGMA_g3131.t1 [Chlamydomonas eustigma]